MFNCNPNTLFCSPPRHKQETSPSNPDHKLIDSNSDIANTLYSNISSLVGLITDDDNPLHISANNNFFKFMESAKTGHQNHTNNNELTLVIFGHENNAYVALIPKSSIQDDSLKNYLERNVLNDNSRLKVSETGDAICVVNARLDLSAMYTVDDAAKQCFGKTGSKDLSTKFKGFMNQTSVSISLNPAPIAKDLFDKFDDPVCQQLINKNILTSIDDNNCKLDIQKDFLESELQKLFDEAGIDKNKSNEIFNILKESYKSPSINIQETLDFKSSIPEEHCNRPFKPFNIAPVSAVRIQCCGDDSTGLPVQ